MMCDCERADLYHRKNVKPRKPHKCCECGNTIAIGEQCSKVDLLYDGEFRTLYTCDRCDAVYRLIESKFPDLCLGHGGLASTIIDELEWLTQDSVEKQGRCCVLYDPLLPVRRGKGGRFELVGQTS